MCHVVWISGLHPFALCSQDWRPQPITRPLREQSQHRPPTALGASSQAQQAPWIGGAPLDQRLRQGQAATPFSAAGSDQAAYGSPASWQHQQRQQQEQEVPSSSQQQQRLVGGLQQAETAPRGGNMFLPAPAWMTPAASEPGSQVTGPSQQVLRCRLLRIQSRIHVVIMYDSYRSSSLTGKIT